MNDEGLGMMYEVCGMKYFIFYRFSPMTKPQHYNPHNLIAKRSSLITHS